MKPMDSLVKSWEISKKTLKSNLISYHHNHQLGLHEPAMLSRLNSQYHRKENLCLPILWERKYLLDQRFRYVILMRHSFGYQQMNLLLKRKLNYLRFLIAIVSQHDHYILLREFNKIIIIVIRLIKRRSHLKYVFIS